MRRRIVASLASLFAIFSVGALLVSLYVTSTTDELQNLVSLHEIEGLRRDLVIGVQAVQADLYTARTPLAHELDAIVANVHGLEAAADECASCHHRPSLEREFDEVQDLIEDYKGALSRYITASANSERISRIRVEAADIGDRLLHHTEAMSEEASERLDEIAEDTASEINYIRVILLTTLIVTIGLGVVVSTYLVRSVTSPIERLVGATRVIASGNLEHRIQEEKEAEFAELARHFNAMSAALEKTYASLRSANEDLRREIRDGTRARQEREELQEQLLHARKMQALGTLSAGIAHEFGNFLQVIQACAERLATKIEAGAPGRREIDTIGDAARKGADLTRRLLTFGSKLESTLLATDINERVRHAKTIFEKALPPTIEVRISLADGILPVAADPAQIEQVLLNLALNARDAMPDGGVLHIETSRETDGSRLEEMEEPEEWIVLKVSDTGHGMDEETVRHIFDPFFTTKKVGVGTGLGLATAYGIITSHGGEISCKSELGRGTVFETRLPAMFETSPPEVAVDAAAPEAAETPKKQPPRESETILWVDDDVAMLEVMRDNLEEYGYAIHTADSGEKALELFREQAGAINLVVLDLGMPGMGGRVCLEKLLEIDPDARVIITTGFGTREEEDEMMRAGARGFLAKPAQISDILAKIEEVMSS